MLLFVDESGHDHRDMPCEVLAGVAVAEDNLWNLVRAVRAAEKDHFGDYLRNLLCEEIKARKILHRRAFREADKKVSIEPGEQVRLAHALLEKGKSSRGKPTSGARHREIVAYHRTTLNFVHAVLDIAASHNVQVFASVVAANAPRPEIGLLRKDYVYLFERYFYFLETFPPTERGLIVFDELEKSQAHLLIQQMAAYFLGTATGRHRSSRIVPEPFFVHSELTTGVFLADLAAYILGWGWRLKKTMRQPCRFELLPFAEKLHEMQFRGEKPDTGGDKVWSLYGIVYLDDMRGQLEREVPMDDSQQMP